MKKTQKLGNNRSYDEKMNANDQLSSTGHGSLNIYFCFSASHYQYIHVINTIEWVNESLLFNAKWVIYHMAKTSYIQWDDNDVHINLC